MKPNSGLKGVDNRPFYDLDLQTKKKTTCSSNLLTVKTHTSRSMKSVFLLSTLYTVCTVDT